MIELSVKLLDVKPVMPYYRKDENGYVVRDASTSQPIVEGYKRQVVFATLGIRPDMLVFTIFQSEPCSFSLPIETRGKLHFVVKANGFNRHADDEPGDLYPTLQLVDLIPNGEIHASDAL